MNKWKKWRQSKIQKKFYIIGILLFSFNLYSIKLSDINGTKNLSNYNEIKDISAERIVDIEKTIRNKNVNRLFFENENEPFTGIAVSRENKKIIGFVTYINGRQNGLAMDYYENGKLRLVRQEKEDITIESLEYNKDGSLFRKFKSTDGLRGILIAQDKKERKTEMEVIEKYTQTKDSVRTVEYILDGKSVVYDKKGKIMGEMNFKNDSIKGLPQKAYKNGKLKYYMVSAKDTPEDFEAQDIYKEYYDNSEQIKYDCDEVSKGSWHCLEYGKNGKMKQEFTTPLYELRKDNSFFWNAVLGVLNILLYGR